jgi:hypothetical protein
LINCHTWEIESREKETHSPVHELHGGKEINGAVPMTQSTWTAPPPPPSPVPLPPERTASQGLSLNRSQYGGCSTKYNTPAGTQVVCRRFGGEQAVFPESSLGKNSSRSSSLTPAACPGVRLAGAVDAAPLAKRRVPTLPSANFTQDSFRPRNISLHRD